MYQNPVLGIDVPKLKITNPTLMSVLALLLLEPGISGAIDARVFSSGHALLRCIIRHNPILGSYFHPHIKVVPAW
jgi:hypothetical protein